MQARSQIIHISTVNKLPYLKVNALTFNTDKAFRHGDIEEILPTLLKNVHLGGSEGLWGILKAILTFGMAGGLNGVRFGRTDVDRIYFVSRGMSRVITGSNVFCREIGSETTPK